jgi:hypothetical protein
MLEQPSSSKPFVIVEPATELDGVRPFVQFCGSEDEPLYFDAPPLGVILLRCSLQGALDRAELGLRAQNVHDGGTALRIVEDNGGGGIWRRIVRALTPSDDAEKLLEELK